MHETMNLLRSVISVQTMLIFLTLTGLYQKFTSNKLIVILAKIYCIVIATVFFAQQIHEMIYRDSRRIRLAFQIIYYLVHVLIGLFNMDKFIPVANDIRKFDDKLLGTKLRDEIPVSRLFFLTFLVIRVTTHSSYCYFYRCNTYIFFYDVTLFISHFPRIMMFELLWHRMALIRKHFELKFSAHRVENGGENVKEVIRNCLITYKSLLDTLQQSYAVVKPLMFIATVVAFPIFLNSINNALAYGGAYTNATSILESVLKVIACVAPAAFAELVNMEVDKLKLLITKQLMFCQNDTTREAIDDAMMFFEQYPFKFSVWRVYTVDGKLILSIFSLLTTYTVAMVQFAHIYN